MSAPDLEPDTLSLRKSRALPSGNVPSSSSCIESALRSAVSVASTPTGSKAVTTGRVLPSTQMLIEGSCKRKLITICCATSPSIPSSPATSSNISE